MRSDCIHEAANSFSQIDRSLECTYSRDALKCMKAGPEFCCLALLFKSDHVGGKSPALHAMFPERLLGLADLP